MATIVTNDLAPEGDLHFSLAGTDFEVPYETNDRVVLGNASVHPWLDVQYDESEQGVAPQFVDRQPLPQDDPLSAANDDANDPEAVAKAIELTGSDFPTPLAVEAGKDQGDTNAKDAEVNTTLASDETDSAPKSRAKKGS